MVCLREWLCAGGGYSMPMFQCGVDKCWSRNVGPHASGSRRVCVRARVSALMRTRSRKEHRLPLRKCPGHWTFRTELLVSLFFSHTKDTVGLLASEKPLDG